MVNNLDLADILSDPQKTADFKNSLVRETVLNVMNNFLGLDNSNFSPTSRRKATSELWNLVNSDKSWDQIASTALDQLKNSLEKDAGIVITKKDVTNDIEQMRKEFVTTYEASNRAKPKRKKSSSRNSTLTIYIEQGTAPNALISNVLAEISILNRMIGGNGIRYELEPILKLDSVLL